jgi:MOSC domain-containing protein YiiM
MKALPVKRADEKTRVISVNVGKPRSLLFENMTVVTAIFKEPATGKIPLRGYNLEGDQQADLRVHGGPHKAVYLYPREHYAYWSKQLPDADIPFGAFGENLTTSGLLEEEVRIGDRFRIGSAVLQVTQPRMPCYKLGVRFGRADMVKRFWNSGRSGIYFSVVEEGELAAGDPIEKVAAGPEPISVAEVVRLYRGDETDPGKLESALRAPLYGGWKRELDERRQV